MSTTPSIGRPAARWAVLALTLVAGAAMGVIMMMRGQLVMAVVLPLIVIGYGLAVTVFAGRSDVAAQLSGHEEDERRHMINLRASATTGNVLALALACGFFYELARGELGGPFACLGAVGGVTYAASSAVYTRAGQ